MKNIKIKMGNMVWYPLKTLQALGVVLGILCMVWVGASFIEVWCKNIEFEPIYSAWNYFNLLVK